MLSDHDVAEKVMNLMKSIGEQLNQSLIDLQGTISEEEYAAYRRGVACIMAEMLINVENPISDHHPDLRWYDET